MALTKVSNNMLLQPVNHNILINPSFTVNQRGDVVDHNNTYFGPDRWKIRGLATVGGTMSQSTTVVDPTTGINKLLIKHRNATSYSWVYQNIEAVNIQGLYSKEMTFSFSYSDVGGSGIPKVAVWSWDSSAIAKSPFQAVPTSLGNNRWACTFTLTTADGTIPDPSEAGMQVCIYPNEKNNAPDEWRVWETELEVGSVATPFVARPYGEELALCQRYYEKITSGYTYYIAAVNGPQTCWVGNYKASKRAIPTVSLPAVSTSSDFFSNTPEHNQSTEFGSWHTTLAGQLNNNINSFTFVADAEL